MRISSFGLLILSACAAFSQTAQQPQTSEASATKETKPEDRCSVEGAIFSLKTGQPIRKAEIDLRHSDGSLQTTYSTTSDGSGHYIVENVEPGKYSLHASRNGYVNTSYGTDFKKRATTLITLVAGQHMTKVDMRLQSQAVVTGRVVDEDGEPMANVRMQLMSRAYRNGKRGLAQGKMATTDDKGEYRLFGVAGGKYWLLARLGGGSFTMPLADSPSSTKEQTSYPATYYPGSLSIAEAGQIQVVAGAELAGLDFRLTRVRSFTVSGKLVNSRTAGNPNVQLLSYDNDGAVSWESARMTMADAKGKYVFREIQAGRYALTANMFSSEDRKSAKAEVVVLDSDVEVPLVFGENPDLRGSVRLEDPSEALAPGLTVNLQPETAMTMFASAEVKDNASFTLKSVPRERLRLAIHPLPEGHFIKSVQLGDAELDDTIVDLSNGVSGDLTITLSAKGAMIGGTVQDDQQKPVTSGTVVLVPDDHKLQSRYRSASPDQNGQFTMKNIHPGSYKVFAFDSAEYGIWLDADWLKTYEAKGDSLELKELDKLTKNLTVIVTDEQ